ncbi:MAG TPA: DUF3696 domain-containing protein [Pyrinomonadaceae bacterium]|jgi:predicted ATPase
MAKTEKTIKNSASEQKGITRLSVSGFKSISQEQSIEIRPLTILAGTNSSGKSSMMQPLLLLKQTLEASYDPGALLLDGPNVRFTSTNQLLSHATKTRQTVSFQVGINVDSKFLSTKFKKDPQKGFDVEQSSYASGGKEITFYQGMTTQDLLPLTLRFGNLVTKDIELSVVRSRCFLYPVLNFLAGINFVSIFNSTISASLNLFLPNMGDGLDPIISQLIHLPGLRGNPERTYPVTAFGAAFPGTFQNYVASVITQWQVNKSQKELDELSQSLRTLNLTWKVVAKPINDTQVELQVGRLPQPSKAGASDMVSIADVGVGVSQTLPVLVALQVAKPGQLVYIEQPEIHLHPRAQTAMAQVLANAARRGVRVVAETHSSLLILGIQTLVAEGKLAPELVKLHWFERRNGRTEVTSRDLDEAGAFGDWPEDFADVMLEAESRYLDAAEARLKKAS